MMKTKIRAMVASKLGREWNRGGVKSGLQLYIIYTSLPT